jgi:glycosyltransferase involved in cell wall biosynthesis
MATPDSDVTASVLILTYNQKHLIQDTLLSVLGQNTSFAFEIVIGDDASADGTAEFCEYLGRNFPRLKVLRQPNNLGHVANFHATLSECKGRYVALLGGDDIWHNPLKLEQQVQYLISHPDFVLSHTHNNILEHSTGKILTRKLSSRKREGSCFEKLAAEGNFITASTAVFDAWKLTTDDIRTLASFPTEDYPLWLLLSQKGNIHYLKDSTVNYRVIEGSLGRPINQTIQKRIASINAAREIALYFAKIHTNKRQLVREIDNRNDVDILRMLLSQKEHALAKKFVKAIPLYRLLSSARLARYFAKTLFV